MSEASTKYFYFSPAFRNHYQKHIKHFNSGKILLLLIFLVTCLLIYHCEIFKESDLSLSAVWF